MKLRIAALLAALAAPLVFVPVHGGGVSVTALYVGQGDCSVIDCGGGRCVIIDCGSSSLDDAAGRVILPFIKYAGFDRVDAVFLSHPDTDHVNALPAILDDRMIEVGAVIIPRAGAENSAADVSAANISAGIDKATAVHTTAANTSAGTDAVLAENDSPWTEIFARCEAAGVQVSLVGTGDVISVGELSFTVLSPSSTDETLRFEDTNENSLVLLAESGAFSALFCGDIGAQAEAALTVSGVLSHVDYLKCPHHGSRFSSTQEFLSALTPSLTVVSAGRNNLYGHPADETMERIAAAGSLCFVTAESGAVTTRPDSGTLRVTPYRAGTG